MCGGGGGGSDAVDYQREQEQERQQNIAAGKRQLEQIFAGLEGDSYREVNPTVQMGRGGFRDALEDALRGNVTTGTVRERTGRLGASDNSGHANQWSIREVQKLTDAGRQQLRELGLRDSEIRSTDPDSYMDMYDQLASQAKSYERVEGTGTPIWDQQEQAYLDYANPQLDNQYDDAQQRLTYALANQGQLSGSLTGDRFADLNQDYDLRRQEVADQARGYANQARGDIASQKQSLLQMLNATADPGATASAARSAVDSLQSTPSFSALGPLFQNTTAGLASAYAGQQAGQAQQRQQGIIYGRDPDRGSGSVLNG